MRLLNFEYRYNMKRRTFDRHLYIIKTVHSDEYELHLYDYSQTVIGEHNVSKYETFILAFQAFRDIVDKEIDAILPVAQKG